MSLNDVRLELAGVFAAGRVGRRAWALSAARVTGVGRRGAGTEAAVIERALQVATQLRKRGARLHIAGEPSALRALRVAVELLAPDAPIRWWSVPPADLAQVGTLGGSWLILEGPVWCDSLAETAVAAGRSVAVAGVGEGPPPPRGGWLADVAAGDPARGAEGLAGLVALGWAAQAEGLDVDVSLQAFMGGGAAVRALEPSPPQVLARVRLVAQEEASCTRVLHVVDDSALERGLAWASGLVERALSTPPSSRPLRNASPRVGTSIVRTDVCVLGDETALGAFLASPEETLVVAWRTRRGGEGSRALTTLCAQRGVPFVGVDLASPVGDPARVGAFVTLLQEMAEATARAHTGGAGSEPAGVQEWRAALGAADVDADPGSA